MILPITNECPSLRTRLLSALDACPDMPRLTQILARATTTGLWPHDPFLSSRIIAFSAASSLSFAQLAFDSSPLPSAFSYNVMIRAHSSGPTPSLSLLLFSRMRRSALYPDRFTFPFLLRASPACAAPLHSLALRHGLARDPHVATSLLHAYASTGLAGPARKLFDEMPERTTVTWNVIISSCSRSTCLHDRGLSLFAAMLLSGDAHPNPDTFIAALTCCGAVAHGQSVHALLTRRHMIPNVKVGTALVHMYAKCGSLNSARTTFETTESRDASTWTAMIGGLAMHGRGEEAFLLFERMAVEGVTPDSVTLTSVLHACSHAGLVDVGITIFKDMKEVHGIEARIEHYGAMVNLLGRAGRLEEAERIVESMPFTPNQVVWGSLLHACMVNGELGLVERLENRFLGLGLGLEEGGFCVGVSNVYAGVGRWDEVGRVRDRMVERGVRKEIGFSLVEVNGKVHEFLVGDTRNSLAIEIYSLLCGINRVMMESV